MHKKSIYLLLIFLVSLSCTKESETEALEIRSLSYTNNNTTLKVGEGFVSDAPEVDGDGTLTFSFADVSINDFEGITIEDSTGIITVAEGNTLAGGVSYIIDVVVSNEVTTEIFQSAFVVEMVALELPRNLIYSVDSISVRLATDSISVAPTLEGLSPFVFTFGNDAALPEFLSINEETGVIMVNGETSEVGNYNINLLVANEDGATSFVAAYTVKILAPEAIADFTFIINKNDLSIIEFTNTSQNATSYTWDFGDGSTSTEENPSHAYDSDGEFEVTLTATNDDGFDDQYTETIVTACLANLTGTYLVTNSWCSPSFTVEITRNADGTYYLPRADGGALSFCTPNETLFNYGNIREQCGEILPTGDLEYGSGNSDYSIGDITGGTWDAVNGILTMSHVQSFTAIWPSEWTSTYTRQ